MEVVRLFLTPDDITPPNIRYNPTGDSIQVTADAGATWTDVPGLDTRHDDAYRVPPLGGTDPQCDAAANMVATLREFVDTIINTLDYLALVNAAAGLFARFIGLIGWLVSLILAIIDGLLVIGRTAIDAAFTETAYDTILCILYNNISSDGQVTEGQLTAINADILAQLGSTVSAVWGYTMTGLGEVGLSNAGALGSETGDCAACIEECPGCSDCDGDTWTTSSFTSFTGDGQQVDPFRVDAPTGIGGGKMFPAALGDVGWVMDNPTCVARFSISANTAGAGRWKIQIGDITSVDFGSGLTTVVLETPQCVQAIEVFLHSGNPGDVSFNSASFSWCE